MRSIVDEYKQTHKVVQLENKYCMQAYAHDEEAIGYYLVTNTTYIHNIMHFPAVQLGYTPNNRSAHFLLCRISVWSYS